MTVKGHAIVTDVTIPDSFLCHATAQPGAPALIVGDETIGYGELLMSVRRVAAWLSASGVRTGDRVIFEAAVGKPIVPVIYLAVLWLGAVAVPIDASISVDAARGIAERIEPAIFLRESDIAALRNVAADEKADRFSKPPVPGPQNLCEIMFSSGTTGSPNGVMLTHANVATAAAIINGIIENVEDDREVVTVPFTHSFGLGRLRCILVAGGAAILVPGLRFPGVVLKAMRDHRATGLSCVPAGLALLETAARGAFGDFARHLHYMELGSVPMRADTKHAARDALPNVRIFMHYGLTEASRSTFLGFTRDHDHLDSVGLPNTGIDLEIRDEFGAARSPGIVGAVFIRGATVTSGYWRNEALSRARIRAGGWLDTGDLGWLDEAGYLHLAGRADDRINVGGEKFSPEIVEQAAETHAVVREAACVSAPDDLLGQVPHLFVVLDGEEIPDDLMATLSGQIPAFAIPRHIECVSALPRTASGKLQRAKLR